MTKTPATPVLHLIHSLAEDQRLKELPDQELLRRFNAGREEAAFSAILRRHGPMVLDVCRNMLGNAQDAEDAFQATFLVLAQRAGAIRKKSSVGSWLHGVAYRVALKAQAEFVRRQRHEARAPGQRPTTASDDLTWREVQQALHAELNRLSECYRAPLVLCYLAGKTQDEAAVLLGVSRATVKKRLECARALLRQRLVRRGLGPVALLVAAAWPTGKALAGMPTAVVSSTTKAASLFAAGQAAAPGVVSAKVAALTEGVLKTMLLTKLKIATAVVLGALLACAGAGLLSKSLTAAEEPKARPQAPQEGRAEAPKQDVPNGDAAKEAEQAKEKAAAKLEGKWRTFAVEIAGEALPEELAKTNVWEIADGKITTKHPNAKIKGGAEEEVCPFKIDPTKKPAHIDIEVEVAGQKGVTEAIYKLDGDELTVCLYGPEGARPTEFSSSDLRNGEKGGNILMRFKREKEDKEKQEKK